MLENNKSKFLSVCLEVNQEWQHPLLVICDKKMHEYKRDHLPVEPASNIAAPADAAAKTADVNPVTIAAGVVIGLGKTARLAAATAVTPAPTAST